MYNKFTLACRFWSLLFTQENYAKEETFGISSSSTSEEDHEARQESKHVMNMTPNDPKTEASTCKSSGTQPENSEAWIARIQALTVMEMTSKAHIQVHTNKESREKQPGRKPGPKRAWAGRPGPTGPAHSGPGSAPFGLFIAPSPRATHQLIRHPPPRSREERGTIPERRGSRWLTRVSLAAWEPCMEDHIGVPGARIKIKVGSRW
jgi:hypothetical protein